MLKNVFFSFKDTVKIIVGDKINLILAMIPILLGLIIYWYFGIWIYENVMGWGKDFIDGYIRSGTLGSIVYYLVATILTIMLFFVVNWTFILFISFLASPFNSALSSRIEKKMRGDAPLNLEQIFSLIGKNIFHTWWNELKKIFFIVVCTCIALLFGYIPFLAPIGVFLTILLLSVEFLDYSWGRHNISFGSCFNDIRKNLFGYSFGGAFFFMLVSIPLINLIVPAFATGYFTVLWVKTNERRT